MTDQQALPETVDVAIIGGGVAGLYAGYSLLTRGAGLPDSDGQPTVAILEADSRTGGRLLTITPPGAPHLHAEIGGMRFKSTQSLLVDLIEHLGLPHRPFPLGDMSDSHDLHYLRGERFSLAELQSGSAQIPYDLAPQERKKSVPQLLGTVLADLVPDAADLTEAERLRREREQTIAGTPISDVALPDFIASALSPAGYELVMDGLGYSCSRDPAVGLINMLHTDFAGGEHRTLDRGMQSLPDALDEKFTAAGGSIYRETPASRVERGPDDTLVVVAQRDGRELRITARHVVLALPRRSLELLDLHSGVLGESSIAQDLDAVVPIPAGKLYLLFDQPWWEELELPRGKSVTDLPMRQCLYFGVEDEAPGGIPGNRMGLLVASYTDGPASVHWEEIENRGEEEFVGRYESPPGLAAPAAMVADSLAQLAELHGAAIPQPVWAAHKSWTPDPLGAGWHYWRTGVLSTDVIPRMRQPLPGTNLSVCGEAFSANQGWILGALTSTEQVLRDMLQQPPADWMSADIELGP